MVTNKQYNEVHNFLIKRWAQDADFTDGNCYWFAYILCARFPFLKIYYEPIVGHFFAGDGDLFFDWTGAHVLDTKPLLLKRIKKEDPLWYNRLKRDCIL